MIYRWSSPECRSPRWMAGVYYSAERNRRLDVAIPLNLLVALAWRIHDWLCAASWIEREVQARSAGPTGVEARVCRDIAARQRTGLAKYGCTVEQSADDMLRHAYEESLDLPIYLRAEIERRRDCDLKRQLDDAKAALERIRDCEDAPDIDATGEWQTGLFCGVEDRNCRDRYEGAGVGIQ